MKLAMIFFFSSLIVYCFKKITNIFCNNYLKKAFSSATSQKEAARMSNVACKYFFNQEKMKIFFQNFYENFTFFYNLSALFVILYVCHVWQKITDQI